MERYVSLKQKRVFKKVEGNPLESVPTVWVFSNRWLSEDGVTHSVFVFSTDTELVFMALYKFLHGAAGDGHSGRDLSPVRPARFPLVNDVVGDL